MNCTSCGAKFEAGDRFCTNCGAVVPQDAPPAGSPSPTPSGPDAFSASLHEPLPFSHTPPTQPPSQATQIFATESRPPSPPGLPQLEPSRSTEQPEWQGWDFSARDTKHAPIIDMPVERTEPSRTPTLIVVGLALFLLAAGGGYLLVRFLHRPAPLEQAAEQASVRAGSDAVPSAAAPADSSEPAADPNGAGAMGAPAVSSPLTSAAAESPGAEGPAAGSGSPSAIAPSAVVKPAGAAPGATPQRPSPTTAASSVSGAPARDKPATPAASTLAASVPGSGQPNAGLPPPNNEPPRIGPSSSRPSPAGSEPAPAQAAATAPHLSDVAPQANTRPAEPPLQAQAAPAPQAAAPQRPPTGPLIFKPDGGPATPSTPGASQPPAAKNTPLPPAGSMAEEGIMFWSGRLKKDQTIVIEGGRASLGSASGDFLPGVAIDVWVPSPAVVLAERPNQKNGWNRVAFRAVRNTDRNVTLNIQWKRLH